VTDKLSQKILSMEVLCPKNTLYFAKSTGVDPANRLDFAYRLVENGILVVRILIKQCVKIIFSAFE